MAPLLPSRRSLALLLLVMLLGAAAPLAAFTRPASAAAVSPLDLIAAVNGLRAARGLRQLEVNASLMSSAQAHTDYQASIGSGTHIGPGNTHPLDRARAAGYGGGAYIAVAENITSRRENTPDIISKAIYQDWTDDLHMNTMVNTGLQHAGAGVAVANGIVYLTLDTGWVAGPASPTRDVSGTPPTQGPQATAIPIVPLVTSTPRPDGSVVHVVGYGQVLVNIAAAYGVKLAEIVAWNGITPDAIYAGQRLLVHLPSTKTPPGFLGASATPISTSRLNPSASATLPSQSSTPPAALRNPQGEAALAAVPPASTPAQPSAAARPASIQPTSATVPPTSPTEQPSSTQIAILVTIAIGVLGVIWVSLRKKGI